MGMLARTIDLRLLASLCLTLSCGGKDGPGTMTDVSAGATDSDSTASGSSGMTAGEELPDPCASTCGGEESCFLNDDATAGADGDSCDEGFHCVVTMDCACTLSSCQADCDPADATSCAAGTSCDPASGRCV